MTTVTLSGAARSPQARLDAWIESLGAMDFAATALVIEGFGVDLKVPAAMRVVRIAGCPCCIGQTAMRVALLRLLRTDKPSHILVLPGADAQIERLQQVLTASFAGAVQIERLD